MTPDVNVLVAADRGEHVHHDTAVRWLEAAVSAASRAAPLTLLPTVIVGYVRIVTDQRVFRAEATSLDHALANVSGLTFDRGFRRLLPPRHFTVLKVPA